MKLVECPHCGEWLAWNLQYCSGCGLPLVGPESAKALEHARKGRWRSPTQALPLDEDEADPLAAPAAPAGPGVAAQPSRLKTWRLPLALLTLGLAGGLVGGGLLSAAWRLPTAEQASRQASAQASQQASAPWASAAPPAPSLPVPQIAAAQPPTAASAALTGVTGLPASVASMAAPTSAGPTSPASAAVAAPRPRLAAATPVPMAASAAVASAADATADTAPAIDAATAWFQAGARAGLAEAMRPFYADAVDYYDRGRLTWPQVAADKSAYLRRWPERDYELLAATAQPGCSADQCQVLLQFRWRVAREDGHWRRGLGSTLLGLKRLDGVLRVVSERAG